ncbi:MAG: RT0821/Lpp0805 family surface protein [Gammaproteobacteria bacterium]
MHSEESDGCRGRRRTGWCARRSDGKWKRPRYGSRYPSRSHVGSRADAAVTTNADEDCFRQVLESATDQEQVAWDNDGSSTHYELTPVRSYQRSGQACRELVTEIERQGQVREVYQTACRAPDGRWRIMD